MALYYNLERWIGIAENYGLTDVVLPFLLIFVILFGTLQKVKIFKQKKFNIMISLVISLLVVIPHVTNRYPPGKDVIEIMNNALPAVSIVIVAIVMLFVMLGLFFGEQKFAGASIGGWISVICIASIVWIFGSSAGWWSGWNSVRNFFGEDAVSLVIIIVVFGLIINFITKEDKKEAGEKFMDKLGDFFGAKK